MTGDAGIGGDVLLPRLAAIYSRYAATARSNNTAVSFANTRVVPVDTPCLLAATACVAGGDHIAGHVAVLLDGGDGSATGTIKFCHVNGTGERERPTLVYLT